MLSRILNLIIVPPFSYTLFLIESFFIGFQPIKKVLILKTTYLLFHPHLLGIIDSIY